MSLGKTFIGAKLPEQLKQIYPRAGNPLIIRQASLLPMWRAVNRIYQLGADVISQSGIAAPARRNGTRRRTTGFAAANPAAGSGGRRSTPTTARR